MDHDTPMRTLYEFDRAYKAACQDRTALQGACLKAYDELHRLAGDLCQNVQENPRPWTLGRLTEIRAVLKKGLGAMNEIGKQGQLGQNISNTKEQNSWNETMRQAAELQAYQAKQMNQLNTNVGVLKPPSLEQELECLGALVRTLEPFSPERQRAMLGYVCSRFGYKP